MIHTSKHKSVSQLLFWGNFFVRNKNIKVLLFILALGLILLLHITGIVVMVSGNTI